MRPTQGTAIAFRRLYTIKLGNPPTGAWLVAEYENTGNVGIAAFKGKWTVTDELGENVAEQEVRYTSDTPWVAEEVKGPHVIPPGERFVIVNQSLSGESDKEFATTKDNVVKMAAFYLQFMASTKL